ncbi:hypothetical protein K437DRAFT_56357 [Tilletiaria anomala UBC 951]|uniref:Uncharacterized protein n=1 Tax=Tilletiaria anomala (strain ATCC 24038 / CBS 436.72 / UBC 951) TaxID=1037660 RepID=A0A066WCA8_TILAU|nr:uncharacterized protein K437DRAFT_56357 [Tilletiaria anomala UBC 951]KDN51346.1 hypothetical protein K437DRAFT_56357 [Tilletiaria anomala UBC 951]
MLRFAGTSFMQGLLGPGAWPRRPFAPRIQAALSYPCNCRAPAQSASHFRRAYSHSAPLKKSDSDAIPALNYGDIPYDAAAALDSDGRIPSMPYVPDTLPGTATEYNAHIVVHPYSRPRPQLSWPASIESVSPLMSELGSRCKQGSSLEGYGVSFSSGELGEQVGLPDLFPHWDNQTPKFMRPVPGHESVDEQFLLYVYLPPGRFATVGPLSLETLDEDKLLQDKIIDALASAKPQTAKRKPEDEAHIYVCTHGMRDCRCGVVGGALMRSLKETYDQENATSGNSLKSTKFFAISHVGGHKWAANALVYPHGDWYGNLREYDAALLLRAAQAPASSMHDLQDMRERMVHWSRWRGRLGLSADKQREHYDQWGPPLMQTAIIKPAVRVGKLGRSSVAASAARKPTSDALTASPTSHITVAEMSVPLRFRSYEGEWFNVKGTIGETLKDVAKRHNLPSIEATCGGECECATCHAYFAAPGDNVDAVGNLDTEPPTLIIGDLQDEENDMLDYAITRKPASRLTCQVKVTKELSEWMKKGGRIELPRF